MKKILIAFDIDGTIRNNKYTEKIVANERIRTLLITLSSFKNVKIHVWSAGGEDYARQCIRELGLSKYVNSYSDKHMISCEDAKCDKQHISSEDRKCWHFVNNITPDIAIDDIQSFNLGKINLIVKEK